ncbi:MAG: penicillin-binding protein 2 [Kiritimatiellae bacterium]|nr:penicillin-binding protein 2 [Kiritimatiellia bacterium]
MSKQAPYRLYVSSSMLSLAVIGLGVRLAFLHLGSHEATRARIDRNRSYERKILAGRGAIHDRNGNGNVLAMNLGVKDVCIDPAVTAKGEGVVKTACKLSELLNVPTDEVAVRMKQSDRRFAYVKRFVPTDLAEEVGALGIDGMFFRDATIRHYPQKQFLCHVLGFVNHMGTGSAGVEQQLDRYLRGSPGIREGRVNAKREELYIRRGLNVPALEGANVTLTIDQNIQYMVEKALDDVMEEHRAEGAWALVQRISTGEILALASRPGFDLNEFRHAPNFAKLNRAIGYVYEPGSTLKPAVFAAALEEKTVTPDTMFNCENGAWSYKRRILRDYHPYSRLSVADGLKKSSNILTAKVALTLGDEGLDRYLRAFGFGKKLGIDLPGEEHGILHPVKRWSGISSTRIAIGQGVAVTALQMLGAVCAIANDGFLMKPFIVREVRSGTGEVMHRSEPEVVSRPISIATAQTMRRLMGRVTESDGTGRRARVEGYTVAGKTGTAQKPVAGGYSSSEHVASFVGFLPVEQPEIGVIVVVDNPQPLHTGGRVAAPAFSKIAGPAIRYLNIPGTDSMVARR